MQPLIEEPMHEQRHSWLGLTVRRLRSDPSALVGLGLLGSMALLAILAPLIGRYGPDTTDIMHLNQDPTPAHWFGTDYLGRDMWARVWYGGRISLPAGLGVIGIAGGLGVPLGLIAGYCGTFVDGIIMRLVDVILSVPAIFLALGVVALCGPGLASSVVAIGIAFAPYYARLARGSTLQVRESDYVKAAHALGAGHRVILLKHILPNVVDPLIVLATLNFAYAILATAALSYLGLGTQLPTSDWGTLLSQGYEHMFQSWSEVTFPGLALAAAVLGINLLGDGLSNALQPQS